jgi:tetratricopeptide (TPR) repeat protein
MKKMVCEMCGGNDLLKEEGVFICQSCGTKYSIEEARRMMVEIDGPVDVSGSTVKVDNSAKLDNLYKIARRAKEDGNMEQAYQKYEALLMEDPDNWEPAFYSAYYSALLSLKNDRPGGSVRVSGGRVNLSLEYRSGISSCIRSISNCLDSVFSLIENIQDYDEQKTAVETVWSDVESVCSLLRDIVRNEHDRMKNEIDSFIIETGGQDGGLFGNYKRQNKSNKESYEQDIQNLDNLVSAKVQFLSVVVSMRRIDEYWEAHQDEKVALESEKESLNEQINALNAEISAIPGYSEMVSSQEKIQKEKEEAQSSIREPKTGFINFLKWGCIIGFIVLSVITIAESEFFSYLPRSADEFFFFIILPFLLLPAAIFFGVLRSKMRKTYKMNQAQIEKAFKDKMEASDKKYTAINNSVNAIQQRIEPLQNRINEIDHELTKPR